MSGDEADADGQLEIDVAVDSEAAPPEPTPPASERPSCHLIAFAGGRGGTGRSLLAANVAVYLAQAGKKVVALDADPAGGPLHQLLGATRPARGFGEMLRGKATGLGELIVDTPVAGVGLIAGEAARSGRATAQRAKVVAGGDCGAGRRLRRPRSRAPDSTLTLDL